MDREHDFMFSIALEVQTNIPPTPNLKAFPTSEKEQLLEHGWKSWVNAFDWSQKKISPEVGRLQSSKGP